MNKRSGLTLVEFFVILVILGIFSAAMPCCPTNAFRQANMTAVGTRGRDIYVAITGVNTERKFVGLPPIWPSDAPPYSNHITGRVECFDFTSSTDYFKYIFDEEHYGADDWKPLVADFDYRLLAGPGVKECKDGKLTAENNMWTIAKNITDATYDIIPFMVTRNLDAEYLWDRFEGEPNSRRIPLGKTWENPFSNKGAVIIRKGGGAFNVRAKYAMPLVIYNRPSFDYDFRKYPLKYLTPDKEVLPIGKVD